jgi:hypothetical protein
MFDPELEAAVAKVQKSGDSSSKAEQYAALKKFSNRQRLPNESEAQAFTRMVTTDPYGKALYKTYTMTKGASFDGSLASGGNAGAAGIAKPQTGRSGDDADDDSGFGQLKAIADALRVNNPQLSPAQATNLAMKTPEGARAYAVDRQQRLGKAMRYQTGGVTGDIQPTRTKAEAGDDERGEHSRMIRALAADLMAKNSKLSPLQAKAAALRVTPDEARAARQASLAKLSAILG